MAKAKIEALETLFRRHGYEVRYLRGPFRGGACRIIEKKLVVINALYPPMGRLRLLASAAVMIREQLSLSPEEEALIERYAL